MKVILDATVIRSPRSGVHISVEQETCALIREIGSGTVVPVCVDADAASAFASAGAHVLSAPLATRSVTCRIAWQQFVLPRLLKREQADLLHALAYTAPLYCPIPYVLNVHDIIALERPELCSALNVLHMRTLLPGSVRSAAKNIVSTTHVAEGLNRLLDVPWNRIEVVPLGVDFQRFSTRRERPRLPGISSDPYLLFVGNLEPKKGLPDLLDAFEVIRQETDLSLVIVGRQAWCTRETMHRLRELEDAGGLTWLGRVDDELLPALYQHAWAFVFPSVEEGFGMPILEAMAAGTPVIHSDHPAVVEAAGGAGHMFPRGDVRALSDTVLRLRRSPEGTSGAVQAGLAHAAERSWEKWAGSVAAILCDVGGASASTENGC